MRQIGRKLQHALAFRWRTPTISAAAAFPSAIANNADIIRRNCEKSLTWLKISDVVANLHS
jgi:hypothetical protein